MTLDARLSKVYIHTYEEMLEIIKRRYAKGLRGVAGIQMVHDVARSGTDGARELGRVLSSLHPFYMRLLEIEYEPAQLTKAISCVTRARAIAERLLRRYARIERGNARIYREARGRILSAYKRCRKGLALLKSALIFLQRLPHIEAAAPTIIVAGPPNVGKSTFVSNVSTAKPEVASYPFTTKEVIVGHMYYGGKKIQIIDTPGLLDRPLGDMNKIERRAVAALKELSGVVLFFVDPTVERMEEQLHVLENVRELLAGKRTIICINKADVASKEAIERAYALAASAVARGLAERIEILAAISKDEARRLADIAAGLAISS